MEYPVYLKNLECGGIEARFFIDRCFLRYRSEGGTPHALTLLTMINEKPYRFEISCCSAKMVEFWKPGDYIALRVEKEKSKILFIPITINHEGCVNLSLDPMYEKNIEQVSISTSGDNREGRLIRETLASN